ncbi:MAG: hypothetical protein P8X58_00410 [Syntrophobacterales bacterium]
MPPSTTIQRIKMELCSPQGPPVIGVNQEIGKQQREGHPQADQQKIRDWLAETEPQDHGGGDAHDAVGATGDLQVAHNQIDDDAEAQSDDGQIIFFEAQGGKAQGQPTEAGEQHGRQHRQQIREMPVQGGKGGNIGPNAVKRGVAQRNLAGITYDEIQAQGQDNENAG